VERLRKEGCDLVCRCAKQRSEPGSDKRVAKVDEFTLRPLELIDRIASLGPPPFTHRHRYFGVLAPNSPPRAAVTTLVTPVQQATADPAQTSTGVGVLGVVVPGNAAPAIREPVAPPKRSPAHYMWVVLIARIFEVFPLLCPICCGQLRLFAFITYRADIMQILDHIGADSDPPLWGDGGDAQMGDGKQIEPDWDTAAQPVPDYEVDQRVNW
jgi:hypothetical protein